VVVRRQLSSVVLFFYWVLLILCCLTALFVTVGFATTGQVTVKYLPTGAILGLVFGLPILIGWRIWVHKRARRAAALLENFDTEQEDG
jgi:hypothetical protein